VSSFSAPLTASRTRSPSSTRAASTSAAAASASRSPSATSAVQVSSAAAVHPSDSASPSPITANVTNPLFGQSSGGSEDGSSGHCVGWGGLPCLNPECVCTPSPGPSPSPSPFVCIASSSDRWPLGVSSSAPPTLCCCYLLYMRYFGAQSTEERGSTTCQCISRGACGTLLWWSLCQ